MIPIHIYLYIINVHIICLCAKPNNSCFQSTSLTRHMNLCVMQRRWFSERSDGIKSGTHSIMNRYYYGRHVQIYIYKYDVVGTLLNTRSRSVYIPIQKHIILSGFISTAAAAVPCVILSVATLHNIIYELAVRLHIFLKV